MFIPEGYANFQIVGRHVSSGQEALTAIGVEGELLSPTTLTELTVAWVDNWAPAVSNQWNPAVARLIIGTSDPSAPIVYEYNDFVFGQNSTEPLPPNVAVVIRKRGSVGGRKNRGRMFLVGTGEAGVDGAGLLSSSSLADFQTRADGFLADVEAASGVSAAVILHSLDTDVPTAITQLQVAPMVGTMRRRLR